MFIRILTISFLLIGFSVQGAQAAGDQVKPPSQAWSFYNGPAGMFGYYDQASMQRGMKIYREVCAACHGLKRVYFRNLTALGYNESQIKNIASEYTIEDGPNDEGDMFDRPKEPKDTFGSPFANDQAAKYANNGAMPPDLSLITKARANGPDYLYALLTGYKEPPAGEHVAEGQYWNAYFPGHKLSMAPPLSDGQVAYEDGSPETLDQYARDVTHFLTWAADPYMEERKKAGLKVLIFLLVFAGIMYSVKKKIWKSAH